MLTDKHIFCGRLKKQPKLFTDLCYKDNHYLLADKGYSYIRKRNFHLITPRRAGYMDNYKENTLNKLNSNITREVTAVRNVVEHVIGTFKNQWKKLVKYILNIY